MNRDDPFDGKGDLVATNLAPNEDESSVLKEESISVRDGSSLRSRRSSVNAIGRVSNTSFSSCIASSLSDKSKKSRAGIINSAFATLMDEGVTLDDILRAFDPSIQRKEVTSIGIGKSPAPKQDTSPVVPRRSSEPCLPMMLSLPTITASPEFRRRSTQMDDMLYDFEGMQFSPEPEGPTLTQAPTESGRKKKKAMPRIEGILLECPHPDDDEIDSDLTKTDPEEEDSSQERSKTAVISELTSTSSPKSRSKRASKSPRARRRRQKQPRKNELPMEDAPMSPSQFNRRSMPSSDNAKVELAGSPASTRLSIGIRSPRISRGRSPFEYHSSISTTGRGGRRRALRSGTRHSSLDETYLTPRRSNRTGRGEKRWSGSSQTRTNSVDHLLETPKRTGQGGLDLVSPASDQASMGNEVPARAKILNTFEYQSPQLKTPPPTKKSEEKPSSGGTRNTIESTPPLSGSDRRAPTASGPTPSSRRDTSEGLREKMHSLECPPPL